MRFHLASTDEPWWSTGWGYVEMVAGTTCDLQLEFARFFLGCGKELTLQTLPSTGLH